MYFEILYDLQCVALKMLLQVSNIWRSECDFALWIGKSDKKTNLGAESITGIHIHVLILHPLLLLVSCPALCADVATHWCHLVRVAVINIGVNLLCRSYSSCVWYFSHRNVHLKLIGIKLLFFFFYEAGNLQLLYLWGLP